jgi:competence protein ComEC
MATALRSIVLGIACALASSMAARAASPGPLQIYFIDVEGGQSTLVVTPEKHTLLIDAGFASDGKGFTPR